MTTPLRAKYVRDLAIRGRAERTQQSYSRYVSELARYYHRSPELISYQEVADWLYYLIKERELSASSVNIAVNAVRFLYGVTLERNTDQLMASVPRMKHAIRRAEIYAPSEVEAILSAPRQPRDRVFLMTVYACGLRCQPTFMIFILSASARTTCRCFGFYGSKKVYAVRCFFRSMIPSNATPPTEIIDQVEGSGTDATANVSPPAVSVTKVALMTAPVVRLYSPTESLVEFATRRLLPDNAKSDRARKSGDEIGLNRGCRAGVVFAHGVGAVVRHEERIVRQQKSKGDQPRD